MLAARNVQQMTPTTNRKLQNRFPIKNVSRVELHDGVVHVTCDRTEAGNILGPRVRTPFGGAPR